MVSNKQYNETLADIGLYCLSNRHNCIDCISNMVCFLQTKNPSISTGVFVGLLGFEPRQTESKSVVLPLHHNPILKHVLCLGVQK
jgi:hypothetical protein